jgi:hypothetical protein
MAFSAVRVGEFTGGVVGELAFTRHPHDSPQMVSLIAKGRGHTYSYWDLMPDGSMYETPVLTQAGGEAELAAAAYNQQRVVTAHRSGPNGALKLSAWKTGGIFDLSDDHVWTNDQDPVIVPFGAVVPTVASLLPAASGSQPRTVQGAQSSAPGTGPGGASGGGVAVATGVVVADGFGATYGPKVGRAVMASRTADNHLRLSLWMFDNGGQIKVNVTKVADVVSSLATAATIVKLREFWSPDLKHPTGLEIVAVMRTGGKLRLERWTIDLGGQGTPPSFQLTGEVTAPETIVSLSAATVDSLGGPQLVTPVRMFTGNVLKIIGWKMEPNGAITRLADVSTGAVGAVASASVRGRCFVTATRESNGYMKARYWLFPNSVAGAFENKAELAEDSIAESFSRLTCLHFPGVAQNLGETVVAARGGAGQLRLWRYHVSE